MKSNFIIAAICITLGFSAAWMFKPDAAETETNTANTKSSTERVSPVRKSKSSEAANSKEARGPRRSSVTVTRADSMDDLDPEMKAAMEEGQAKQRKMMRDRMKGKFDLQIASMVEELGLNADQEKELRAYFDKQLDIMTISDPMEAISNPEKMKEIAAAIRGEGMQEHMKEFLSEEQIEALDAREKRQRKNKIEGVALKDLSKIQQSLDLSDDQRDEVYNILVEEAEQKLDNKSDANVIMDGMMQNMGIDMDMGDIDMGSLMQLDPSQGGGEVDRATVIKKMKEDRARKIDAKVERLAPVLNEAQQKQYRNQLENKNGMFNMMMQGM